MLTKILKTALLSLQFSIFCIAEELPLKMDKSIELLIKKVESVAPPSKAEEPVKVETPALYYLLAPGQESEDIHPIIPRAQFLINDIPDIQDIDLKNIVAAKLTAAYQYRKGTFIAESSGLFLDAMNGLPGPFYSWFQRQMGNQGLLNISMALGNDKAEIISVVGYAKSPEELYFFQGRLKGRIVSLRRNQKDSWEPIFQPEGNSQTLAEMDPVSKNALNPRRYALEKLKAFLDTHD